MKRNYNAKADQTAIATDINDLPINKKVIKNAIETSSKKVPEKVLEYMIEKSARRKCSKEQAEVAFGMT
jgi:ribosomal protein S17E